MKYVLLGTISPSWIGKQTERLTKSNDKLKQLGIKQEQSFLPMVKALLKKLNF